MIINITEYLANALLDIFSMDLSYFESAVPVTRDIVNIAVCVGWALLLGNLVFQAMKTMATGLGFEGEDPKTLFGRTFVMSFLLLGSRQICDIGLGITKKVITMIQLPEIVQVPSFEESAFTVPGDASWLLVIIVGIILIVQIVKLFFEVGERYVIVAVLTVLSPLAFAMGGSKNTSDIFKGWVRMFASMCLMMVLSIVFLKLILSAMSVLPTGLAVIPWTVFIVALARMGRKIDGIIARVGLNPAITGDPLGHSRIPGMLSLMVMKNMAGSVSRSAGTGKAAGAGKPASSGSGSTAAPASRTTIPTVTSGAAPASAGPSTPSPVRPPIGSSAPGTSVPASSSTAPTVSATPPSPASVGHAAPASAKSADTSVYKDSSSAPPLLTPGRDSTGTGTSPEAGTRVSGTGASSTPPSRPPVTGARPADRPVITRPVPAGKGTSASVPRAAPEKVSAASTSAASTTDRPPADKASTTGTYGDTATHEKTAGIKPSADRPTAGRSTEGKPTTERPAGIKPVAVSPRAVASPAERMETPSARPVIGSGGAGSDKAGVSTETVPRADIPGSASAKSVPPSASAGAGMPLADKLYPVMPRAEMPATGKPSSGITESPAATAMRADRPAPSVSGSKTVVASHPSGSSVDGRIGGMIVNSNATAKGAGVSKAAASAFDTTLHQKAVLPKRESPGGIASPRVHSRPTAEIISHGFTPGRKDDSKYLTGEGPTPGSHTGIHSAGEAFRPVSGKGIPEREEIGGVHKSYDRAEARSEHVAVSGHRGSTVTHPAVTGAPAIKPSMEALARESAGDATAKGYSPPRAAQGVPNGKRTERRLAGRKITRKRPTIYKLGNTRSRMAAAKGYSPPRKEPKDKERGGIE